MKRFNRLEVTRLIEAITTFENSRISFLKCPQWRVSVQFNRPGWREEVEKKKSTKNKNQTAQIEKEDEEERKRNKKRRVPVSCKTS